MAKKKVTPASKSGNAVPPVSKSRQKELENAEKFIAKYGKNPGKQEEIKRAMARIAEIERTGAGARTVAAQDLTPDPGPDLGINDKTGRINSDVAAGTLEDAAKDDSNVTFNMSNPGSVTDAFGNTQSITRDPVTGEVKVTQSGGAGLTAANTAFTNAALGFANSGDAAQAAADANYAFMTRDLAKNKSEELEAKKQELAQRGIPIDETPGSLWSNAIGQIDKRYSDLDNQARQQSILTRDNSYATQAGVLGTLGNVAQGQAGNFTPYQGGSQNTAGALGGALGTIAGVNAGINSSNQSIELQKQALEIERQRKLRAAGGGGTDQSPIIGGTAPGFGV